MCERSDVYASACAVSRAYPLYSRKTSNNTAPSTPPTVYVHFLIVSEDSPSVQTPLSASEIACLQNTCYGVRLAAKIVDAPCNDMNVDHFIQVRFQITSTWLKTN